MKRLSVVVLCFVFVLCGCGSNKKVKVKTDLLTFGCNVDYNGDKYSFDVKTLENGEMDCLVTAPQTLVGMRCVIGEKKVKIDYMGMEIEKSTNELPFGSAVSLFFAVIKDAKDKPIQNREKEYFVSGKVNGVEYTLNTTDDGIPLSINCESEKIFMEFVKLTLAKASEK
ncbi:MAG TPA: hypothetical protein DEW35_01885 [Ruminococcaceae bacterium]|nr:hypothetical protein [Oscillospiraceae bacterium]